MGWAAWLSKVQCVYMYVKVCRICFRASNFSEQTCTILAMKSDVGKEEGKAGGGLLR